MTYILSCITEDVVYQVSDRRFTDLNPPHNILEESNKAVLYANRMIFSYTGLGYIGGQRTDDWLAGVLLDLPSGDIHDFLHSIADAATEAFSRIHLTKEMKRHAFRAAGWVKNTAGGERPFIATIPNAMDEHQRWTSRSFDVFGISLRMFPAMRRGCYVSGIGANIDKKLERANRDTIRNSVAKRPASPTDVLAKIHTAVRRVSRLLGENSTVGRSVNCTSLPRAAIEESSSTGEIFVPFGTPMEKHASFYYVDEKDNTLTVYGPTVVFPRNAVMSNITIVQIRYLVHDAGDALNRAYLVRDGVWEKDAAKAHRFGTEEEARTAIAANPGAVGYETYHDSPTPLPGALVSGKSTIVGVEPNSNY